MPIRIVDSRVDWGWSDRTEDERAVVQRFQPRLDEADHTIESFSGLLAQASAEIPSVAVAALVDEDSGARTLLLVKGGAVTPVLVKDSTRRYSITLGQDDKVRALAAADKTALFPVAVSAMARLAAGDLRVERALYFPEPMMAMVQAEASRLDRSWSYVVQLAWKHARAAIQALPDRDAAAPLRTPHLDASKVMQTLIFPTEMLVEIEAEAARFDSSQSWVVQLALSLAAPAIAAMPAKSDA